MGGSTVIRGSVSSRDAGVIAFIFRPWLPSQVTCSSHIGYHPPAASRAALEFSALCTRAAQGTHKRYFSRHTRLVCCKSPMAYRTHTPQRCGRCQNSPATSTYGQTAHGPYLLVRVVHMFGQNVTEHNPAPSDRPRLRSPPLLSGPPTLNDDIHQIFTCKG